jgi:hypothetical protein
MSDEAGNLICEVVAVDEVEEGSRLAWVEARMSEETG